ncbi:MAG: hypothetical protein U5M50_15700 [Sphingobium sp.]|nr:hypothetical protein [Sphingobium sp.]
MIAGERLRASLPIAEGTAENNAGTAIPGLTQAEVDNVIAIAKSRYNYDARQYPAATNERSSDDRLVGTSGLSIMSDTQRVSLTGTYTEGLDRALGRTPS